MWTSSHGRICPVWGAFRNPKSQSLCTFAPSPWMIGGASEGSATRERKEPPNPSMMWQPWQLWSLTMRRPRSIAASSPESSFGRGHGGVQLLEAENRRDHLVELRVGEAEVRHLELLLPAARAVAVEDARGVELRPEPVLPGVRQVQEAEVEAVDRLRPLLGQLGADRLGVLEAGDLVAGVAAVVRDQFLAGVDLLARGGPSSRDLPSRRRASSSLSRSRARSDRASSGRSAGGARSRSRAVPSASRGTPRCPARPPGPGAGSASWSRGSTPWDRGSSGRSSRGEALRADAGEVRAELAVGPDQVALRVRIDQVAAEAARASAMSFCSARGVSRPGDGRHRGRLRPVEQVGDDRVDHRVVLGPPARVHCCWAAVGCAGPGDVDEVLEVEEGRHLRVRPEGGGIHDPARRPVARDLRGDLLERRPDPRELLFLEALDPVAAPAAERLDRSACRRRASAPLENSPRPRGSGSTRPPRT